MKIAFWTYVAGQGLLVGAAMVGKLSIWVALIPTFVLIGLSAGIVSFLLLFEFMFNNVDACTPMDEDGDDEDDDEKDSE